MYCNKFLVTEAFICSIAVVVNWFCFYENIWVESALNFFNITTMYRLAAMFVIVDLQIYFLQCLVILIICRHKNVNIPNANTG